MNKKIIENFFEYWCRGIQGSNRVGEPTHKELYTMLLHADISNKVILKEEELKQDTYDPYFVNRIFLTALLVKPENWNNFFIKKLTDVLTFAKSKPDSHVKSFSNWWKLYVLKPIEKLLNYVQAEDKSNKPDDLNLPFILPQDAVTQKEWSRIGTILDEKQFQIMYQQNKNSLTTEQRIEMLRSAVLPYKWHRIVVLPDIVIDMIEKKETVTSNFFIPIMEEDSYGLNSNNIEFWKMVTQINENKKDILKGIELIEEMLSKKLPIKSYSLLFELHYIEKINDFFFFVCFKAIEQQHIEVLKFMVEEKKIFTKINHPIKAYSGQTLLQYAVECDNVEVVDCLLSFPPPVNSINWEWPSLADIALINKNFKILKLLADQKVDLAQAFKGHLDCSYINEDGCNLIYLFTDSQITNDYLQNMIALLVRNGVDINKKNQDGLDALFLAVDQGNLEKVKVLTENKADITKHYHISNHFDENITLLHHAASKGYIDIIEYLVQNQIDIHHQAYSKATALNWAANKGQIKAFQLLADYGCDVNNHGNLNYRPVHYAARDSNLNFLQLLAEYKADFNVVTFHGHTPLNYAIGENFPDGVEFLLKQHVQFDIKQYSDSLIQFLIKIEPNKNYTTLEHVLSKNFNQLLAAVISYIRMHLPQQKTILDDIQNKKHFLGKVLDKPTVMHRIRSSLEAQFTQITPYFPLIKEHAFAAVAEIKQPNDTMPQLLAALYDNQESNYKYEKYELVLYFDKAGSELKNDFFDEFKKNKTPLLIKYYDKFSLYGIKNDGDWQLAPIQPNPILDALFDDIIIKPRIVKSILKRDDPLFNKELIEALQIGHIPYNRARDYQPYKTQMQQLLQAVAQWAEKAKLGADIIKPINQFTRHFYEAALDKQPDVYYEAIKKDLEKIFYALCNPNIKLSRKKSELTALARNLGVCGPGLFEHIEDALKALELPISLPHWLADLRDKIIYQFVEEYAARTQIFEGNVGHAHAAFQIHAANNGWAPMTEVKEIKEHYLYLVKIKQADYQLFEKTFLEQYNLKNIIEYIATSFIAEFNCQRKEVVGVTEEEVKSDWILYNPKLIQIANNILNSLDLNFDDEPFDKKEENQKFFLKFNPVLFKQLFLKHCYSNQFLVEKWSAETVFGDSSYQLIYPTLHMKDLNWIRSEYKQAPGKVFNISFSELSQIEQSHYFSYSLKYYITLDCFHLLKKPYDKIHNYFPSTETLKILINELEKDCCLVLNADFFKRMLQEDPKQFNSTLTLLKSENIKPLLESMKLDRELVTRSQKIAPALTPHFSKNQYPINEKKFDSITSILEAAETGDVEMLRHLVEHKKNLNLLGETSLYLSLKNNHISAALFLLGQGAGPVGLDFVASTLQVAIASKQIDLLKKLLERKADVNLIAPTITKKLTLLNEKLSTPLLLAVASDNGSALGVLLAHGANPFVCAEDQYAYDMAVSPRIKKLLLAAELDFLTKKSKLGENNLEFSSALSSIKNALLSNSSASLKDISSSSPLVQDYLTKACTLLSSPLELKLSEMTNGIYTKKITDKSINYIALSTMLLELENDYQTPVIKLRIPSGDREEKIFYQYQQRNHWHPYSQFLFDLRAFQKNKTFNYELVQVDNNHFEVVYRFPELMKHNKSEVIFYSKKSFDLQDPQCMQLLTSFEESLPILADFHNGFIEIATSFGTVASTEFKEWVMYRPFYQLFKRPELNINESIRNLNLFKPLVDVKAYPNAIAYCVRYSLKLDNKFSLKKLEEMIINPSMLSWTEEKLLSPNEFLEIVKHFHPKDAALLDRIIKEVICKQGIDIKYLLEFDKKDWHKINNINDFVFMLTLQLLGPDVRKLKKQQNFRNFSEPDIGSYIWIKDMLDGDLIMHKELIEKHKTKQFILQGQIDLVSKGCTNIKMLPLKDSRIAIVLRNNHDLQEIMIYDCKHEKIITTIPRRIIFKNDQFDLQKEAFVSNINELPNGDILISFYSQSRKKNVTLIWNPLTHSCKKVLDERCIRIIELSNYYFIMATDSHISLYKLEQDIKFCDMKSYPHDAIVALTNDEFVTCTEGVIQFFQIKNERIFELNKLTVSQNSLCSNLYFLKDQNQLIVVKTLYDKKHEKKYKVIDSYNSVTKMFISSKMITLSNTYYDTYLLPDKCSLLFTNNYHDDKHFENYIYNIQTNEPAKPFKLLDIDFCDNNKSITVLASGHILISFFENNLITKIQMLSPQTDLLQFVEKKVDLPVQNSFLGNNSLFQSNFIPNTLATDEGILFTLEKLLGNTAHVINPALSSVCNLFDSGKDAAIEYAKKINGFVAIENGRQINQGSNGYIQIDGGQLKKPIVAILNTASVRISHGTDTEAIGGSHWVAMVFLPKNYLNLENKNEKIFLLDSLNPNREFPEIFKRILIQGDKHIFSAPVCEDKNAPLLDYEHEILPAFPHAEFVISPEFKIQQKGTTDCGWWAVDNVLKLIKSGTIAEIMKNYSGPRRADHLRSQYKDLDKQNIERMPQDKKKSNF